MKQKDKQSNSSTKRVFVRWTSEEENVLRKYYGKYTIKILKKKFKLNKSVNAIIKKAKRLNLKGVTSNRRWTQEEISALASLIEKHPDNLQEAFRLHSAKYNRPHEAVQMKYYAIRHSKDFKTCFVTVSGNKLYPNGKLYYPGVKVAPSRSKVSTWRKVLNFFGIK